MAVKEKQNFNQGIIFTVFGSKKNHKANKKKLSKSDLGRINHHQNTANEMLHL